MARQRRSTDYLGAGAPRLTSLLRAAGSQEYLGQLIDFIGEIVPHDRVTVTRYSTEKLPEFLTYRNFDAALVKRYLDVYYPYDPFYGYWCEKEQTGVVPLRQFSSRELKQGRYIAEFLYQSLIRDEVGMLLDDGPHATLAVFLEHSSRIFRKQEIERLRRAFLLAQAAHAVHRRLLSPDMSRNLPGPERPRRADATNGRLPQQLWPDLTTREREVAAMILAGHPPAAIAERLGISTGTVRIHRHNIYAKLDISTEREVFLQYIEFVSITR
jgi:DNA-binding CsgD family transcriptional regulator